MAHANADIPEISRDELLAKRQRGEPFILVDVLSHDSYEHIHLPGAINVPVGVIRDLAPLLFGKDDEVIVYCASFDCTASPTATKILLQMGFTNVKDYAGGITDWIESDLPVVHHEQALSDEENAT